MVFETENSKVILKKSWCKYSRTNVTLTVCQKYCGYTPPLKSFLKHHRPRCISSARAPIVRRIRRWKSITSLSPFLTLWILVELAGSSDEDIFMVKVRTKREKRPQTSSLRFDLLSIKMCTWDNKPWRSVLRCGCLTSVNHEVVCGGDREIFVTIIEGSLEFDLILLKLFDIKLR